MSTPKVRRGSTSAPGVTLEYVVEGRGTPVLVVGSARYYPRTFSRELRRSCTLACVDLRHFAQRGDGDVPCEPTLDLYADDVERLRAAVGFDQAVIVGHSHHGCIALEYAKRYPERATHVVMIGSPPTSVPQTVDAGERYWAAHASEKRKAALRRNREALRAAAPVRVPTGHAFVARYVADGPRYWYDPDFDAGPLWDGVHVDVDAVGAFRGLLFDLELSWNPARMAAPVLVVMGRQDYVVPHLLWDSVLPKLENVTYRLLERSGHTPQLEESGRFDELFLGWIRASSAQGNVRTANRS